MTDSFYTDDIKRFVFSRPWPKGLVFDIIEYEDYLGFRFYRDNFNSFDGEDRLQIAQTVRQVMEKIRSLGIPTYMEVEKNVPREGNDLL